MDPKNPATYAFWQAFETAEAKHVLADSASQNAVTVEKLRKNLASALIDSGFQARQAIKLAVASGAFTCFGHGDDMNFITYECKLLNSRIILGRSTTRRGVHQTVTKVGRANDQESWAVEAAFANHVAKLQQNGRLHGLVVPVLIDSVDQLISFKQCMLGGKLAPTLGAHFANSLKLKEKILMWCKTGAILVDLHDCGLIHGDFSSSQVCITDHGPILLDLESMLDCREDIYVQFSSKGVGWISQFLGNNKLGRFTRLAYYDWTQVAQQYCHEDGPVRILSTVARQVETRAFAINMLEHLTGSNFQSDIRSIIERVKSRHQAYFAAYPDQQEEIIRILTELTTILFDLRTIRFHERSDFAKTIKTLSQMGDQLPA